MPRRTYSVWKTTLGCKMKRLHCTPTRRKPNRVKPNRAELSRAEPGLTKRVDWGYSFLPDNRRTTLLHSAVYRRSL